MNSQKPEPLAKGDGSTLDFHSMFLTIQGEGPFSGHRAVFVRLAGCNLQCPGCDTEYTNGRRSVGIDVLLKQIEHLAEGIENCLVVITGGEPLRQRIGPFVDRLLDFRYRVQIESNGVFAPDDLLENLLFRYSPRSALLCLVVSPKTSRINDDTKRLASVFKYVLDHREVAADGLPMRALMHTANGGVARPRRNAPVYINPFDSGDPEWNQRNLVAAATSAIRHGYILGVQLHKLVGLE